jgi:hypothetical protein
MTLEGDGLIFGNSQKSGIGMVNLGMIVMAKF